MSLRGYSNENVQNKEIHNVLVCPHCNQEPCVWIEHRENVVAHVQANEFVVADNGNMPNNEKKEALLSVFLPSNQ